MLCHIMLSYTVVHRSISYCSILSPTSKMRFQIVLYEITSSWLLQNFHCIIKFTEYLEDIFLRLRALAKNFLCHLHVCIVDMVLFIFLLLFLPAVLSNRWSNLMLYLPTSHSVVTQRFTHICSLKVYSTDVHKRYFSFFHPHCWTVDVIWYCRPLNNTASSLNNSLIVNYKSNDFTYLH
jgi:hypothetical protein